MQQAQALLLTTFVLAKGNFAEAETRFRAGLEMSPSDGSLHYYLGISLHSLNQLQGAEASYITALENLVGDAHKTHRAASRGSLCQILSQVSIPSHSSAHSAPYGVVNHGLDLFYIYCSKETLCAPEPWKCAALQWPLIRRTLKP